MSFIQNIIRLSHKECSCGANLDYQDAIWIDDLQDWLCDDCCYGNYFECNLCNKYYEIVVYRPDLFGIETNDDELYDGCDVCLECEKK
jgi:hypothetical protein